MPNADKFGGIYVQLGYPGKYGENVYVNTEKGLYIYKTHPEVYVIGVRNGGLSFSAYSKNTDLYSVKSWNIYSPSRTWIIDDEMCVSECQDTPEDCLKKDAMIVYSKYLNIRGGYHNTDKILNDGYVYYNDEDKMYLYRISRQYCHRQYNCWVIGPREGANQFYMKSENSNNLSPELVDWGKSGISVKSYKQPCHKNDIIEDNDGKDAEKEHEKVTVSIYEDESFPASSESIGIDKYSNASWVRAFDLQPNDSEMVLFHGVEPNDILQGSLGDCWLLCALAAIAEFPNFFKDKIFKTDKVSPNGKYSLNLYNSGTKSWETITIDDRIPCEPKKWYDNRTRPLFAQPNENEMYLLLIEKAFAKVCGSYGKLSGGYPALAWMVLTGCEDLHFWGKNSNDKSWTKRLAATEKIRENPWNFQGMWIKGSNITNTADDMFDFLKNCDEKNYVMGAAIHGDVMEKARSDGLIERHAYSLISVYSDKKYKMIQLRNPWGNNHEWNGDWSDKSSKWNNNPELKEKLMWSNKPDGLFWMSWTDFNKIFHDVQIAAITMDTPRSKF
tara:strand:+ start:2202 stop:3869 length:1668 start_codon:yes stop_codon:yes gene_type:complete